VKPNFFIVGAPKCGTTALATYLKMHDDIFLSDPKEPHFFADDFPIYKQEIPDVKSYEKLFAAAALKNPSRIGEASVWYLYSKSAISNIKKYCPEAKIIVMLRKPSDVIASLHKQLLWTFDEDEVDLAEALKNMPLRMKGACIPKSCREPKFLQYFEVVKFGEQIERLFQIFPKEQIKVIFFDEFRRNTQMVYKETLEFLDVEYDGRDEFPIINERKRNKYAVVARFTHKPAPILVKFIAKLKNVLGIDRIGFMRFIQRLNSAPVSSETLSLKRFSFWQDLVSDVGKIERYTNKDLGEWKR